MIRHVAVMKFAPDCTVEQHQHVLEMLRGLGHEVEQVRALSVGAHALSDSATPDIALIVDLDDRAALAAYTIHPYHLALGQYFGTVKDSATVVDIELP